MDTQTQALIDRLDAGGAWAKLSREFYKSGTTWQPTLTPATSGSYSYSTRAAEYWRVGEIVHITGRITISGTSAPSGALSITGLPFTAATVSDISWQVSWQDFELINLSAGYTWSGGIINSGGSSILIREYGDNVASQSLQAAAFITNSSLAFAGWYIATGS